MHLKLRRSQRSGGMMSNKVVFAIDARADLTPEERGLVSKYALGKIVVYDSDARKKQVETASAHFEVSQAEGVGVGRQTWSLARGLVSAAVAALTLRITIDSLSQGQHIECKDLNELLGAEAAILEACKNFKAYLATALTFDGREEVIEF